MVNMDNLLRELATLYQNVPQFDDGKISRYINNINENNETLIGVQLKIKKKFDKLRLKNKLNLVQYPDFLVVNTPNNLGKYENLFTLGDGFKAYVSLDINNGVAISQDVIEFIVKNNIASQLKIRNYVSNDAFTIRVTSRDDMEKIIDFLNKNKKYKDIRLNPFIPTMRNVNVVVDGEISYNRVLAKLIENYLYDKKINKKIEQVSSDDFGLFIYNLLNSINKNWEYYSILYGLSNKRKYQDFVIVATIIRDNIQKELSLDDLEKCRQCKKYKPADKFEYSSLDVEQIRKGALKTIITKLKDYYYNEKEDYIEYLHEVMKDYVDRNNINAFTRKNKTRLLMEKYYSREEFKNYIMEIGYEYFLKMCYNTKKKYGDKQLQYAIAAYFQSGDMQYFTNDENIKSTLKYMIPSDWLFEIVKSKNVYEKIDNSFENETMKVRN